MSKNNKDNQLETKLQKTIESDLSFKLFAPYYFINKLYSVAYEFSPKL
jgi:hypothetical protein